MADEPEVTEPVEPIAPVVEPETPPAPEVITPSELVEEADAEGTEEPAVDAGGMPHLTHEQVDDANQNLHLSKTDEPLVEDAPATEPQPPAADPDAIEANEEGADEPVPIPDHGELSEADYSAVGKSLTMAYETMGTTEITDCFGRAWWAQYQIANNQSVVMIKLSRGDDTYSTMASTSAFSLEAAEVEDGEEPNDDPIYGMIKAISAQVK